MTAMIVGAHSRGIMVVWPLAAEPAAWRGAFLGLLVGWHAHSRAGLRRAWFWGVFACLAYEWLSLHFGRHILWRNVFDLGVSLHFLLNTAIISAGVYWVLEATQAPARGPAPHPAGGDAEGDLEKEPAGEAARR